MDPAVQRLCERWDIRIPQGAIQLAVRTTFPELKSLAPPVDLRRLAAKRKVVSISTTKMQVDGVISSVKGSGYVIELNRAHSVSRRRFTVAHEIGHTFFLELEDGENQTRMRVIDEDLEALRSSDEEALCNIAAAEILMPPEPFARALREFGSSVEGIVSLSRRFRASLWATARRVLEFRRDTNFCCALWEYYPQFEYYKSQWIVQSERIKSRRSLFIDKESPAFRSFHNLSRFRTREWVSLGGPLDDYIIDGIVLRNAEPRRVLTAIVFGKSDEWLSKHEIIRSANQLTLFDSSDT